MTLRTRSILVGTVPRFIRVYRLIFAGANRVRTRTVRTGLVCPGGVPVHPGGTQVHPGSVPVNHGLRRIIRVYHGRIPVLSRFVTASSRFYPVLTSLTVRPGCIKHLKPRFHCLVFTAPFSLPRFAPVKKSRYTVKNRGTVSTKIQTNMCNHCLHTINMEGQVIT